MQHDDAIAAIESQMALFIMQVTQLHETVKNLEDKDKLQVENILKLRAENVILQHKIQQLENTTDKQQAAVTQLTGTYVSFTVAVAAENVDITAGI